RGGLSARQPVGEAATAHGRMGRLRDRPHGPPAGVTPAAAPEAARPSRIARLLSGVTATGGVAGGGRMPRRAAQARITIAFTVPLAKLIAAAVLLVSTTVAVPGALI